jgi:hypothetical protein
MTWPGQRGYDLAVKFSGAVSFSGLERVRQVGPSLLVTQRGSSGSGSRATSARPSDRTEVHFPARGPSEPMVATL